ncbi:YdeI/OmpD-associated family protein [bacterium]|nr:YdeI/OmpD-associated family protein [bacterium]
MSDTEPLFVKNKIELRKWFVKNHKKADSIWIGLFKKTSGKSSLSSPDLFETALCFGWSGVIIKSIDIWSYKIKIGKRKKNSVWSATYLKKFKELKAKKLIHPSGQLAYDQRNKIKSGAEEKAQLSSKQLSEFKKNKKAWEFFNTQAAGYKKYVIYWVSSAKRVETQEKRLRELIRDSADGTKLKRILIAQEKAKPKYEEGKTPIEASRNLGISTGADFRSVDINTLEQLRRLGYERAVNKVCELYPHRLNLNFFYAVMGAIEDQDWKKLDPDLKAQAKDLLNQLKHR